MTSQRIGLCSRIELSLFRHYLRGVVRLGGRPGLSRRTVLLPAVTTTSTTTATSSRWQLREDGFAVRLDRSGHHPHRGLVWPLVWIETLSPFDQPVALLRGPGATGDALHEVDVGGAEAGGLVGTKRTAQRRVIFDHHARRRRRRPGWLCGVPRLAPAAVPLAFPIAGLLGAHRRRLAPERVPVETDVRVRVLEGLARLFVKRTAAELDV
jgi:hypothetical protein